MSNRHRRLRSIAVGILAVAALAGMPGSALGATSITLQPVASGFVAPTQVTNAHDGTNRLFVVEQRGTIRAVLNGVIQPGFFLDIRSKVEDGGERGLLGLAFDPRFKTNHRFYVYYTRNGGDIVVSRFTTNAVPDGGLVADRTPARADRAQRPGEPQRRRAGIRSEWLPVHRHRRRRGRGGSGQQRARTRTPLLGKILRINVNGTGSGTFDHYSVPRSNPFAGSRPGRAEIWAYGLRNPWRISFDRANGQFWIADVGQNRFEEIDREKPGATGGRNYGWDAMEGLHCYTASKCPLAGDTLPNAEY